MSVKLRMFLDGDEFSKFMKFAGNYLDTYILVFTEEGLHVMNTDTSKVAFFSKKFEHIETEHSVIPEEPLKFMVSDMIVDVIKKMGSKGYYMIEYNEGEDHITIGHGDDIDNWDEFYKVYIGIIGSQEEAEEIYKLYDKFYEIKDNIGVYEFKMTVNDFTKIVKISKLFDSNITFKVCKNEVKVILTKDGKEHGSKKFNAETCELRTLTENIECVKTSISNSLFKYFNQIPKTTEYIITIGDDAPLVIEDTDKTFLFVIAPIKE